MSDETDRHDMSTEEILWPSTPTTPPDSAMLHQSPGLTVRTTTQAPPAAGADTPDTRPTDAEVLYRGGPVAREVQRYRREMVLEMDLSEAEQEAVAQDYAEATTGLYDDVSRRIVNLSIERTLAAARRSHGEQPDAEAARVAQQWDQDHIEARDAVLSRYGVKEGQELLARTVRWVQSQPRLAALLREVGVGTDPTVVMGLVQHVLRENLGRA